MATIQPKQCDVCGANQWRFEWSWVGQDHIGQDWFSWCPICENCGYEDDRLLTKYAANESEWARQYGNPRDYYPASPTTEQT